MMRTFALLLLLFFFPLAWAQSLPILLSTRPVPLQDASGTTEQVSRIRSRGMIELPEITVSGLRLSQLSGLAWDDDARILYAISDKGALFHLRPLLRDEKLVGAQLLRAVPLREASGIPVKGDRADSEGLDIVRARNKRQGDTELVVSFERSPRIARYRTDGTLIAELPLPAPINDPKQYRDKNKMLESVCVDDKLGALALPEVPLRDTPQGQNLIYRLEGGSWTLPIAGKFRPSAMECLGNGYVLILERDFGLAGRAIQLRRAHLAGDGIPGSKADLETLAILDSAAGYHIDNFEGLARHQGNRFFAVSDNNDLFLQRSLLLYFELND